MSWLPASTKLTGEARMVAASQVPSFKAVSPPAESLARFASTLAFDDIPAPARERGKLLILDALGVGLASNAYPFAARSIAGIVALAERDGACSVLGRSERLPVRDAALANGILIHGLDFDDTHLASIIHATAACLPCALSLSESLDVD